MRVRKIKMRFKAALSWGPDDPTRKEVTLPKKAAAQNELEPPGTTHHMTAESYIWLLMTSGVKWKCSAGLTFFSNMFT